MWLSSDRGNISKAFHSKRTEQKLNFMIHSPGLHFDGNKRVIYELKYTSFYSELSYKLINIVNRSTRNRPKDLPFKYAVAKPKIRARIRRIKTMPEARHGFRKTSNR